jgi:PPOX class probable F420-dependent enzyme
MTEIRLDPKFERFLNQANVAVFAAVRPDGFPSLSAVWYEYDPTGVVRVSVTKERAKYRYALRDPRVALCVASGHPPYMEVVLEGNASITEEGGRELIARLCDRYYGGEEGRKYAEYTNRQDERLVLQFRPSRVRTWDFSAEDDHHRRWGYDVSGLEAHGGEAL